MSSRLPPCIGLLRAAFVAALLLSVTRVMADGGNSPNNPAASAPSNAEIEVLLKELAAGEKELAAGAKKLASAALKAKLANLGGNFHAYGLRLDAFHMRIGTRRLQGQRGTQLTAGLDTDESAMQDSLAKARAELREEWKGKEQRAAIDDWYIEWQGFVAELVALRGKPTPLLEASRAKANTRLELALTQ